jgi:hypothetical protein
LSAGNRCRRLAWLLVKSRTIKRASEPQTLPIAVQPSKVIDRYARKQERNQEQPSDPAARDNGKIAAKKSNRRRQSRGKSSKNS